MRNNKKILICALTIMGLTTIGTPVTYANNMLVPITAEASEVEAKAYIYEWLYKVIDGHLYKRLYNATKEEWVGDWILVE